MIKPYKKECDYSYTLGFYPSFELIKYHKEEIIKVLIHSSSKKAMGTAKLLALVEEVPVEENDRQFEKLATKENDHVIVVFKKYESSLDIDAPHVVLVNPSDQGNLGNIMRSMAAFSYSNLAIISPSTDRFNPKVIRSSMGSCFYVKQEVFSSFDEYKKCFPRNHYAFMLQAERGLKGLELKSPYALVFGNEARGLDHSMLDENSIKIEQPGEVDSLNLPTAVAIALYECSFTK